MKLRVGVDWAERAQEERTEEEERWSETRVEGILMFKEPAEERG